MFTQDNLDRVLGGTVVDEAGDKIGKVGDIYFDDVTNKPSWVTVNTGLFGGSNSFVPLENASMEGDTIRVPFSKDKVKDAPRIDADRHLSVEEERELYRYYGADYEAGRQGYATETRTVEADRDARVMTDADRDARYANDPDRGADNGADAQAGLAGRTERGTDGVVLHEERVNVGTQQQEAGRVRLRKHVVTEQQTVNVPVTHEEVRVEREAIRDGRPVSGDAFREDSASAEVTLHEDKVVVDKQAVPVERVSLGKDVVTEERQVTEQVRREEVDIDRTGVRTEGYLEGERREGIDYDRDGKIGMDDKVKGAFDRDKDGNVIEGHHDNVPNVATDKHGKVGADYDHDGKVGLGDKIKGVFDKDKDGHAG